MLAMGSSKPWPDALEVMTGVRKMDASAFLEYFKPLEDWLIKTNKELGVHIGWERSDSKKAKIDNLLWSHEKFHKRLHSNTVSFQTSIAQFDVQNGNFTKATFPKLV